MQLIKKNLFDNSYQNLLQIRGADTRRIPVFSCAAFLYQLA